MSISDNYTKGSSLDYLYHQNQYRLIGINLSIQANISVPQQTNFTGQLEEDELLNFYLDH